MKRLGKIAIWIFSIFAVLLFLLVGTSVWLIKNPEEAYRLAKKTVLPKDLEITWTTLDLNVRHDQGLDFYLDWKIENLNVTKTSPLVVFPIDLIQLKALVRPLQLQAQVDLAQLLATKTLKFKANAEAEKKEEPGVSPFQQLQNIMSLLHTLHERVPLKEVAVEVQEFHLLSPAGPPLIFIAHLNKAADEDPLHFKAQLKKESEQPLIVRLDGELDLTRMNSDREFLTANASFDGFGVQTEQSLKFTYQGDRAALATQGEVRYTKNKMQLVVDPRFDLLLDPQLATLSLFADLKGVPGPIQKVTGITLKMTTPLGKTGLLTEEPSQYDLRLPIELGFVKTSLRRELQKACDCELPLTVVARSEGRLWLASWMSESEKNLKLLESQNSVESMKNKLFDLDLKAQVNLERENHQFRILPILDSRILVHSLQGLQPFLKAFHVIVPAPLDVLDGKIDFVAQGPVKQDHEGMHFPARLETQLSSQKQKINIQAEATVTADPSFKKMHISTVAKILDLQLELPPLNPIGGNPRLAADKRILKEPTKAKEAQTAPSLQVTFDVKVETAQPGSIRLLSEFFKPYLPLTLNFRLAQTGDKNSGVLKTEPFDVVYLRRRVQVEKMQLDLNQLEQQAIPVDGRLKIKQTLYTIYIDIQGLIQKPTITMSSDPYLPESEIISVLLYDRTSDQLQSGDAETAGNVQAAMADRAIGLFGLWAFASTPIRSFSYNPVTKMYTATVELADGVTAGIGTTWESTAQLELRKRVTRQWMLTARWNAATQDEDQNTELVLQWEKRY